MNPPYWVLILYLPRPLLPTCSGSRDGGSRQLRRRGSSGRQQGRGRRTILQHQARSFSRGLQPAGEWAPSARWERNCRKRIVSRQNIFFTTLHVSEWISCWFRRHQIKNTPVAGKLWSEQGFLSCFLSVWERLALLPHQQRPQDANRLHPQRSPLRHREVSPRFLSAAAATGKGQRAPGGWRVCTLRQGSYWVNLNKS